MIAVILKYSCIIDNIIRWRLNQSNYMYIFCSNNWTWAYILSYILKYFILCISIYIYIHTSSYYIT